jgi:predicted Zn-dependent protease
VDARAAADVAREIERAPGPPTRQIVANCPVKRLEKVIGFKLAASAAVIYVRLRGLQREKVLRDAALEGGAGSDRYFDLLHKELDYRFANVGFHLKYAEALVARNRMADAAVEARLILVQDPYNFNGNLLLANSYYSLGLLRESIDVCDQYLAVSGYCFEFSELRELCQQRMGTV